MQSAVGTGGGTGGGTGTGKVYRKMPPLPFVPWTRSSGHARSRSKVAVGMLLGGGEYISSTLETLESSDHSTVMTARLQQIMDSPPLLEAFEEFCQRALCSEVGITTPVRVTRRGWFYVNIYIYKYTPGTSYTFFQRRFL